MTLSETPLLKSELTLSLGIREIFFNFQTTPSSAFVKKLQNQRKVNEIASQRFGFESPFLGDHDEDRPSTNFEDEAHAHMCVKFWANYDTLNLMLLRLKSATKSQDNILI